MGHRLKKFYADKKSVETVLEGSKSIAELALGGKMDNSSTKEKRVCSYGRSRLVKLCDGNI